MVDSKFEKQFRLLSASDFKNLRVGSSSYKKPSLIIYFKKNSFNQTRIGISASKKVGKSHDRNRIKRIIREYFRTSPFKFYGYDILFVVSWAKSINHESLETKETHLLKNMDDFFKYFARDNTSIEPVE